jgi:phage terminase large subunit
MPLTEAEQAELDRLLQMPPDSFYARDPIGWMVNVLGIPEPTLRWSMHPEYANHVWDGTPDPLCAIADAIAAGHDVGVESATGTGKTFLGAGLALWFQACFEDSLVITTAPVEKQLEAQCWKEIGSHFPKYRQRYPMASTVKLRVRLREGAGEQERWAIIGYGCGVDAGSASATRAQGFHAAHMLVVTEETPGIDAAIMTALANTCTGLHNIRLALGNPDHQLDSLHTFCIQPGVVHVRISALDHPNVVTGREVIPGATTRKFIAGRLAEYGSDDHPMYRSRVRGFSPAEASDALIKLAWCERSAERWKLRTEPKPEDLPAIGVDVAQSEAGDKAAVAKGRGNRLMTVKSEPCNNATALGRDVARAAKESGTEPRRVGVDAIGVGAATLNALREELGAVQALYGGGSPVEKAQHGPDGETRDWMPDANRFKNLRSQMWWQMREDLRNDNADLPHDPELFRQLVMPTFREVGNMVVVESKDEVKKRLGRSPDDADAVVYWNWVRARAKVVKSPVTDKQDDRAPRYDYASKSFKVLSAEDQVARAIAQSQPRSRTPHHKVPARNPR